MPKQDKAETTATKKRTVLSPVERAAKLQAEAEALLAREAKRAESKLDDAIARLTQLEEQRDKAQAKVDAQKQAVADLRKAAGIEDEQPTEG